MKYFRLPSHLSNMHPLFSQFAPSFIISRIFNFVKYSNFSNCINTKNSNLSAGVAQASAHTTWKARAFARVGSKPAVDAPNSSQFQGI